MRNIEIKARCDDLDFIREKLSELKAEFCGIDRQTDTYYNVSKGRLKLRQGNIENALIYYRRENTAGPKNSQLLLYQTGEIAVLKAILTEVLEELVTVEKEREIYFIGNVKIHLDKVEGLGSFAEIEVLDRDENLNKAEMEKTCRKYMDLFHIGEKDLIDCSYSDMLLKINPV